MSRKLEKQGQRVLPGLWKLNRNTWVVRAQKLCPRTRRKINRRRLVSNATRTEALEVLEGLRRELEDYGQEPVEQGAAEQQPTNRETLGDFASSWLKMKQGRGDLASSTANRYATALDHLSSWLTQMPLGEISSRDIEQWMVASNKKFAEQTVNGWLRVLRACLSDALRDGLIARNPAQAVRPLKVKVDLEDTNSLTVVELRKLLDALEQQDYTLYAAAMTQALTGLRWGENSALKWEDHDREARVLRIRRAVSDRQLRPITKTGKSRIVGVPAVLATVLEAHREQLTKRQHPGLASGLMFPSRKGTPLTSGRISDALREACKAAGITKRFTSHGFRRSLTDLLRKAEVDPVIAAGLTGHETERMRKHYSTVRDDEAVEASERVARLVRPSPESTEESSEESSDPGDEKGRSQATL